MPRPNAPARRTALTPEALEPRLVPSFGFDPSFGTAGLTVLPQLPDTEFASDVTTQADGKVLFAVGGLDPVAADSLAVVRLNPDGTPDATFGGDGVVTLPGWVRAEPRSVAVGPDGKVLLAGEFDTTGQGYENHFDALIRLLPDGTRDATFDGDGVMRFFPTFDTNGVVTAGGDTLYGGAAGAAVRPDGSAVVVGSHYRQQLGPEGTVADDHFGFGVIRLTPAGAVDPAFAGDGRGEIEFADRAAPTRMVVQPDGKILAVGYAGQAAPFSEWESVPVLAWWKADGTPDAAFGQGGKLTDVLGSGRGGRLTSVGVGPGGRIVVAGHGGSNWGPSYAAPNLAGYAADGTREFLNDYPFGYDLNQTGFADVAVSPATGAITTIGWSASWKPLADTLLSRFTADGMADTGFGFGGYRGLAAGGPWDVSDRPLALEALPGGDLLAVTGSPGGLAVSRLQDGPPAPQPARIASSPHWATGLRNGTETWLEGFVVPMLDGTGRPTGTLTYKLGDRVLGTVPVDPTTGLARLVVPDLPAGTRTMRLEYSGDSGYVPQVVEFAATVRQAPTRTTLTASATAVEVGKPVTLTAGVAMGPLSYDTPYNGTPTGRVVFTDGARALGTATIQNGQATLTLPAGLAGGYRSLRAVYEGDADRAASTSAAVGVTVTKATATVALASSSPTAAAGQLVTFTATVRAGVWVNGTVTFKAGATVLGTAAVNGHGVARLTVGTLPAGTHAVTAAYAGSSTVAAATSAPVAQTVGGVARVGTTTTLASSATAAAYGQPVTFTASVRPTSGAATPAGEVVFTSGGQELGRAAVDAQGKAVLTRPLPFIGYRAVRATFVGGPAFDGSSAAVGLQLSRAAVWVAVTVAPATAAVGQPVAITVRVTAAHTGTPTGTVTLMSGTRTIGTARLNGNGTATLTTTFIAGSHPVTAFYSGSSVFLDQLSAPVTVAVG